MLCTARVMRATAHAEPAPPSARPAARGTRPQSRAPRSVHGGHPRQGRRPPPDGRRRAPLRPLPLGRGRLSLARPEARSDEERFLSCSLNISWPDQGADGLLDDDRQADAAILAALERDLRPHGLSTRGSSPRGRTSRTTQFAGWLSYSSFDRSWKALKSLHDALDRQGWASASGRATCIIPENWK